MTYDPGVTGIWVTTKWPVWIFTFLPIILAMISWPEIGAEVGFLIKFGILEFGIFKVCCWVTPKSSSCLNIDHLAVVKISNTDNNNSKLVDNHFECWARAWSRFVMYFKYHKYKYNYMLTFSDFSLLSIMENMQNFAHNFPIWLQSHDAQLFN